MNFLDYLKEHPILLFGSVALVLLLILFFLFFFIIKRKSHKRKQENSTIKTKQLGHHRSEHCKIAASSILGTRQTQQDAVSFYDLSAVEGSMQHKRIVAALCDGMGGMQEGAKASRMAAEIITADYKESAKLENIPLFLSGEAKKADTAVAEMKNANGARIEAGTTLTAVIIENSSLFWVSVGDSRIYIFRDHDMARATQDHNYLLTLMQRVKNGEITEAEALNDPSREALISYVGCGKVSLIDYNSAPFELQSGDVILMCSDGLYRSLSDDRIKEIIYSSKSDPELVSHVLTASALDNSNGSQDNTSVILIYYY